MDPNNGEGPPKGYKPSEQKTQKNQSPKNSKGKSWLGRFFIGGGKGALAAAAIGFTGGQAVESKIHSDDTPNVTVRHLDQSLIQDAGMLTMVDFNDKSQITHGASEAEPIIFDTVFEDLFPNSKPDEIKGLEEAIKSLQTEQYIDENGAVNGIGTLETIPQMADLLRAERVSPTGETESFDQYLNEKAQLYGINPNIVKGLIFIESHGNVNAYNEGTGALGIGQFLETAGVRYGLIGTDENGNIIRNEDGSIKYDLRTEPFASVEATFKYLNDLKDLFGGDIGFATWAYHAGEGNVIGALREYILEQKGFDIGDFDEAFINNDVEKVNIISEQISDFITQNKVNVNHVLWYSDAVKKYLEDRNLLDDTERYSIKIAAAGEYFEESPMGASLAQSQ